LYGVLGEHRSDAETIKVLVSVSREIPSWSLEPRAMRAAASSRGRGESAQAAAGLGITRFVVCMMQMDPTRLIYSLKFKSRSYGPSGLSGCCIVVPVQEIEAWILADLPAVAKISKAGGPPNQ